MKITTEGNELVIRISLDVKPVASASGKSRVVATTSGFTGQSTPFGQVKIGLNVITTDNDYGRDGNKAAAPAPSLVKTNGNGAHATA